MRLKELTGIAQNLAAMACSEARLGSDFEQLAELPDGEVSLDLIHGTAIHSEAGAITLSVVRGLASWLSDVGARNVNRASVLLRINTSEPPTNRTTLISFKFKGEAVLEAEGRTYVGGANNHVWHNRLAQPCAPADGP